MPSPHALPTVGAPLRRLGTGPVEAWLHAHGGLRLLRAGDVVLNLFPASAGEAGPANLVLRRRHADGRIDALALCGPGAPLAWREQGGRAWREGVIGVAEARPGGRSAEARGEARPDAATPAWPLLRLRLELVPAAAAPAWFWHLAIDHLGGPPCTLDLVLLQDVGLARWGALRLNEAYASHYIDHQPLLQRQHGWLVASRQNAPQDGRCPWLLQGSLRRAVGYATDALQLVGRSRRAGLQPAALPAELPGRRLQHEHSLVALQDAAFTLAPGASMQCGFFGAFEADHPAPSGPADLQRLAPLLALPEAVCAAWTPPAVALAVGVAPAAGAPATAAVPSAPPAPLDTAAPDFVGDALTVAQLEQHAPAPWRHVETDADGRLLSFFAGDTLHVVTAAKEHAVLRPHGHLLRSGRHLVPDERGAASTVWMAGVFHSSLTQGHASANRLLSTQRAYLGLARAQGLRALVDFGDGWQHLAVPSAWCVEPDRVRWIYARGDQSLQVTAAASADPAQVLLTFQMSGQGPARLLLVHHVDEDDALGAPPPRWTETVPGGRGRLCPAAGSALAQRFPEGGLLIEALEGTHWQAAGGDALLQPDGQPLGRALLCLRFDTPRRVHLRYTAALLPSAPAGPGGGTPAAGAPAAMPDPLPGPLLPGIRLQPPAGAAAAAAATALQQLAELLPWLQHNALVHYLAPRGLEQYSGGGWGTRDVCQGPVELLQAAGRHVLVRDLLCRVFSAQNTDGDWPQWFMFYPRDAAVRAGDSHGDIVFWPLLALAEHLAATGDAALLDEPLPFHAGAGSVPELAPLRVHAERAFAVIHGRRIAGTTLAAYGHGDWNDALQPADPAMREHLCSAWTVTLHHQLLQAWVRAWRQLGRPQQAAAAQAEADAVLADFQRLLLADGVLAGFASFDAPGAPRLLLHPRDTDTGIHYSALAMVHAIAAELFTPEQAQAHAALIEQRLCGPDGLRLFDRPLPYRGGTMRLFQRGESAAYFGREIGLMYMHAHLRWAEALAQLGRGDALLHALRLANPIGLQALVPAAARRQANCYYSSSDAAFDDREQASAHYERIARGEVALEGGWRVYSSGAGIACRLVVQRLLGITQSPLRVGIDPVLPPALNGLQAGLEVDGLPLRIRYRVGPLGHGPQALRLDGQALPFRRGHNRYRTAGVEVALADWRAAHPVAGSELEITLA